MINASQWKQVVAPALADDSGWGFKGKLAYRTPIDWVLTGVLGEGTSHSDQVRIWAVVMPLFVPSDHLVLNLSERVPDGSSTIGLSDSIGFAGTIKLALSSLPSATEALEIVCRSGDEAGPYAALLLGRVSEAERRLSEPFVPEDSRPFMAESRTRRQTVLDTIRDRDASSAVELLRAWRNKTTSAIGVI